MIIDLLNIIEISIIVWYISLGNLVACGIFLTHDDYMGFSPVALHRSTSMNWLGCLIASVIIIAIFPLYCIFATVIWLIWIIFHICRNPKNRNKLKKGEL